MSRLVKAGVNSYNENISYREIIYNSFKVFLEPCEEQGELSIKLMAHSDSKNSSLSGTK